MKKLFLPILFTVMLSGSFSCSVLRNYQLTEADAAAAIRELLQLGTRDGNLTGAFSKEMIMSSIFPESLRKTLNTLNQLGLTPEIERFTNTLGTAAESTATRSVPVFISGITGMRLTDAMRIVKNGGTSATDYLRATIGDSLRRAITPVMKTALNEYKLNEQWDKLSSPIQSALGSRINLDIANLMAGVVSEAMFQKIAEKEVQIRSNTAARTTPLLQRVFSRNWD